MAAETVRGRRGPAIADLATLDMIERAHARLTGVWCAIGGADMSWDHREAVQLLVDSVHVELGDALIRLRSTREAPDGGA